MERNTFLAIILIFLIWNTWLLFNPKPKPVEKSTAPQTLQTHPGQLSKDSQDSKTSNLSETALKSATKTPGKSAVSTPLAQKPETTRILENERLRVSLSSHGGVIRHILLKKYRQTNSPDSLPVDLVQDSSDQFDLQFSNPQWNESLMQRFEEVPSQDPNQAVFRSEVPGVFSMERVLRLEPNAYEIQSELRFKSLSAGEIRLQPNFFWHVVEKKPKRKGFLSGRSDVADVWQSMALSAENKLIKHQPKHSDQSAVEFAGLLSWAGLGNRYFLTALLPMWDGPSLLRTRAQAAVGTETPEEMLLLENSLSSNEIKLSPGETSTLKYRLFLGPKELQVLESQGARLNKALDLGVFEFFALFLLRLMQIFHKFVGNWGVSIILLTLLVKVVFFPLSHKSFKSMKEMQRIQPLMKELQERYKDDKEQLNVQMLKLMREHKVNPFGGCLPMLVQLPIYFALYKVLYSSIELRHAPFFLWIRDLSAPDPYFISPLLMGVAMFLQQRMSPQPPDPVQARMMMIMPIMFTGFMVFLPSGLVIYIFCNTMLTVLQQWYINKSLDGKFSLPKLAENHP